MDLRSRLRRATACEHQRLETTLGLLAAPISKARFVHALCRFHGFHSVWDEAIRRHASLAGVLAGRERLHGVRSDLEALGCGAEEIDRLPVCLAAEGLVTSETRAAGSLYVIEGSSLGGQIISRALAATDWAPPGGLRCFAPYGEETARRWSAFRAWLESRSSPTADPQIEAGAVDTFGVLRRWMAG
jgi:heme oxygenase